MVERRDRARTGVLVGRAVGVATVAAAFLDDGLPQLG